MDLARLRAALQSEEEGGAHIVKGRRLYSPLERQLMLEVEPPCPHCFHSTQDLGSGFFGADIRGGMAWGNAVSRSMCVILLLNILIVTPWYMGLSFVVPSIPFLLKLSFLSVTVPEPPDQRQNLQREVPRDGRPSGLESRPGSARRSGLVGWLVG